MEWPERGEWIGVTVAQRERPVAVGERNVMAIQ